MRKDYKTERNRKIYKEYKNTDTSFNKLSNKYNLTPQRIQAIVKDYREKRGINILESTDPKSKREELKDRAVELREKGKEIEAINLFKMVIQWDRDNNNVTGEVDVSGHLAICYHLTSEHCRVKKQTGEYLKKAYNQLLTALKLIDKNKLPDSKAAIICSHLASNRLRLAITKSKSEQKRILKDALKYINQALNNVPGSGAHKSWFMQTKAKIQHLMGNSSDALNTLKEAESLVYRGYADEVKTQDQARIKLHVWTSSIDITYAQVYLDTGRKILAEHKLASIIGIEDPDKILSQQKQKAKELLEKLKSS